jgi:hypothetical protein
MNVKESAVLTVEIRCSGPVLDYHDLESITICFGTLKAGIIETEQFDFEKHPIAAIEAFAKKVDGYEKRYDLVIICSPMFIKFIDHHLSQISYPPFSFTRERQLRNLYDLKSYAMGIARVPMGELKTVDDVLQKLKCELPPIDDWSAEAVARRMFANYVILNGICVKSNVRDEKIKELVTNVRNVSDFASSLKY